MITESLVKEVFDQLLTAIAAEADAAILSVRFPPLLGATSLSFSDRNLPNANLARCYLASVPF